MFIMTIIETDFPALPSARPDRAPDYFHVMAKPSGAICNLDCKYCFFLSKEALYPGSRFRMDEDVLEAYIRQLIESQLAPQVNIARQGGEPTMMGLDFFRQAMALVEKYRRPGVTIEHTIQTNGTLLDDDWCQFFAEHSFLVGLSLDGPRAMHDANRVDKRGEPTFDKVMEASRRLHGHKVPFNILCTVHAANGDYPLEVYRFFRDVVGTDFIQFIPIIERATPELLPIANLGWGDHQFLSPEEIPTEIEELPVAKSSKRPLYMLQGSLVTDRSIDSKQWGDFLIAIFDEWVRHDVGKVFVQLFDSSLGSWVGQGASLCIHRETCGNALALEHNGDLYSCDHFVEPDYLLGNIVDDHMIELVASSQQIKFGEDKRDSLPQYCRDCEVRFACNGGCPRNRFIETPGGEPGLNYLCAGYKAFFKHVDRPMRLMAELLKRGRYADEVMAVLHQEEQMTAQVYAGVGRNDLCPCGSGKKFKQCHGS
jgi:uncharacterized protein